MKKNNKGKEILKLLQENYEIETMQDLSSALKICSRVYYKK